MKMRIEKKEGATSMIIEGFVSTASIIHSPFDPVRSEKPTAP
jgi:hypothetical protein